MDIDLTPAVKRLVELRESLLAHLPGFVIGLVVLGVFYYGAKLVRNLVRNRTEANVRLRQAGIVAGRLAQVLVVTLGLLVAMSIVLPDFQARDAVTAVGLGGIVVGFAFADIFKNFLAGILILLSHPFRVGDQIVAGSYEGTVIDIQTRATFLRTFDGRRVVIPNADLFTEKVIVDTAYPTRRVEHTIGIGYGDDADRAKALLLEAVRNLEGVEKEPAPEVFVVELAASSVNLRLRWWIRPSERRSVIASRDEVLCAVRKTLTESGIDLPYPTRQILFHDQTEDTDGDRSRQREGWPAGKGQVLPMPRGIARSIAESAEAAAAETPSADRDAEGADGPRERAPPRGIRRPR